MTVSQLFSFHKFDARSFVDVLHKFCSRMKIQHENLTGAPPHVHSVQVHMFIPNNACSAH